MRGSGGACGGERRLEGGHKKILVNGSRAIKKTRAEQESTMPAKPSLPSSQAQPRSTFFQSRSGSELTRTCRRDGIIFLPFLHTFLLHLPHPMTTSQPSPPPPQPKIRRVGPQLLSDEIIADELLADAQPKGGRLLTTDRDPWAHNAWDQVEWDEEQELLAQATVAKQATVPVPDDLQELYNGDPGAQWDGFYTQMKGALWGDLGSSCRDGGLRVLTSASLSPRQVLQRSSLAPNRVYRACRCRQAWCACLLSLARATTMLTRQTPDQAGPKRVVEIGCGPGNTLYPLLAANKNPELQLHGLDFSKEAIALVKVRSFFDLPRCCSQG